MMLYAIIMDDTIIGQLTMVLKDGQYSHNLNGDCMKLKWISSLLIMLSLYGVSIFTYAADVQFKNQSKYDLFLGDDNDKWPTRFLDAGKTLTIDEESFRRICKGHRNHCNFYIFKTFGPNIAVITFEKSAVISISNSIYGITISGYDSDVIIENI